MNKFKAFIVGLFLLSPIPALAQTLGTYTVSISTPRAVVTNITSTANVATLPSVAYPRQLLYVHDIYTASATVGNRYVTLNLISSDGTTVVGNWHTSAAITAGLSNYHVEFLPGTYRETTFDGSHSVQTPFPMILIIPANYSVKVTDFSAVSSSDTQNVYFETAPTQ